MTDLRKAAEAVLERWDSPAWEWKKQGPTADLMANLRTALAAEQPKQEAKQEPVAYFDLQKQVFFWAKPTQIDVPKTIALEPLPLYTAPPDAEALRRDAERYRWLRYRAWFQFEFEGRYGDSCETVQELDAAIDAAMKEGT